MLQRGQERSLHNIICLVRVGEQAPGERTKELGVLEEAVGRRQRFRHELSVLQARGRPRDRDFVGVCRH